MKSACVGVLLIIELFQCSFEPLLYGAGVTNPFWPLASLYTNYFSRYAHKILVKKKPGGKRSLGRHRHR